MPVFFMLAFCFCSFALAADRPLAKTIADKDISWGPCPKIFPQGCEIGVLQGDPQKKDTDIFLRVPGSYIIPPHSHTSAEHIVLIAGNLEVKYQGHATINLKPGTFAYGPAKLAHQAKCIGAETCVLFISFDLPIDALPYQGQL